MQTWKARARDRVIRALVHIRADTAARVFYHKFSHAKRKVLRTDELLVHSYLASNNIKKLHIGCGDHALPGWLNSDYYPVSDNVLRLDASKAFPFKDDTFDFIFTEHMIEHICYADAAAMLKECHRVLKDGGKIRVSTPDLEVLTEVYRNSRSGLEQDFVVYHCTKHDSPYLSEIFVVNDYFRLWGHSFIYDQDTLTALLVEAGFVDIQRRQIAESPEPELRSIDNVHRMPAGLLDFTSICLEGVKVEVTLGL